MDSTETQTPEIENENKNQIVDQNLETTEVQSDTQKTVNSKEAQSDQQKYTENITYNNEGVAIFVDPETKIKYKWCSDSNNWILLTETDSDQNNSTLENEHYRWCTETNQWILKESSKETEYYRWCEKTSQWIPKMKSTDGEVTYGFDENEKCHTYTDKDGVIFFWDKEKNAWFPKIDDDFLAIYQLNYGFEDKKSSDIEANKPSDIEDSNKPIEPNTEQPTELKELGVRKRKAPPTWFQISPEHNSKVYVSNLPLDLTDEEFIELMSKCGMIMRDNKNKKLKYKLYQDTNGQFKGDGLCHYIKVESVDLALNVLDGYDIRGNKIKVERAQFQMKGEYNPALKPKISKSEKKKLKETQEKLFDWRPEKMRGERSKHEKTVIIKNVFEPSIFENNMQLLLEYQNDLREECSKIGTVKKVIVYDQHPDGIAEVSMSDPESADIVIQLMHGRFFGKRKLTAETWDGKTKYKILESEQEKNKRLNNWDKFLVEEDAKNVT